MNQKYFFLILVIFVFSPYLVFSESVGRPASSSSAVVSKIYFGGSHRFSNSIECNAELADTAKKFENHGVIVNSRACVKTSHNYEVRINISLKHPLELENLTFLTEEDCEVATQKIKNNFRTIRNAILINARCRRVNFNQIKLSVIKKSPKSLINIFSIDNKTQVDSTEACVEINSRIINKARVNGFEAIYSGCRRLSLYKGQPPFQPFIIYNSSNGSEIKYLDGATYKLDSHSLCLPDISVLEQKFNNVGLNLIDMSCLKNNFFNNTQTEVLIYIKPPQIDVIKDRIRHNPATHSLSSCVNMLSSGVESYSKVSQVFFSRCTIGTDGSARADGNKFDRVLYSVP